MQLDRAIDERHSVRKFSDSKVNWRKVIDAIYAASKAPLAGNLSTLRFIMVSDKEKIEKISNAADQDFLMNAKFIVVVCTDLENLKREFPKDAEKYSKQQTGAAIENFLLKITDLELASTWIGHFNEARIKRTLKIPENIIIEALIPVGKAKEPGKQRKKSDLDDILFFEEWNNKYMNPPVKPRIMYEEGLK
jgi:nitroreductase